VEGVALLACIIGIWWIKKSKKLFNTHIQDLTGMIL